MHHLVACFCFRYAMVQQALGGSSNSSSWKNFFLFTNFSMKRLLRFHWRFLKNQSCPIHDDSGLDTHGSMGGKPAPFSRVSISLELISSILLKQPSSFKV